MSKTSKMLEDQVLINERLEREISRIVKLSQEGRQYLGKSDKITIAQFWDNKLLIRLVIREGVTYKMYHLISLRAPFSEDDWASYLDMSVKSLQRYRLAGKAFKPIHSEKIIEMAEVTKIGLDVLGGIQNFTLWLNTPNFALGRLKPKDLLNDSYGKELVLGELTRINYGIFV